MVDRAFGFGPVSGVEEIEAAPAVAERAPDSAPAAPAAAATPTAKAPLSASVAQTGDGSASPPPATRTTATQPDAAAPAKASLDEVDSAGYDAKTVLGILARKKSVKEGERKEDLTVVLWDYGRSPQRTHTRTLRPCPPLCHLSFPPLPSHSPHMCKSHYFPPTPPPPRNPPPHAIGGQEVFYQMHHLFLNRNGIYPIVFSMHWLLDSCKVRTHSPPPPAPSFHHPSPPQDGLGESH